MLCSDASLLIVLQFKYGLLLRFLLGSGGFLLASRGAVLAFVLLRRQLGVSR